MTTETYNGWTNRETWALKLWLDTEYGWYQDMQSLAKAHRHDESRYPLARAIENYVEELTDAFFGDPGHHAAIAPMINDVGSFWRVNYREIAEVCHEEAGGEA